LKRHNPDALKSSEAGDQHQCNNTSKNQEMVMNTSETIPSEGGQVSAHQSSRTALEKNTVLPAVDIFEDDHGVTIMADMPGVSREGLGVRVDGDNLWIEGAVASQEDARKNPEMEIVYGEVLNPFYRRSFTLSADLDPSKIAASLNQGVLKLVIPKSEAAKPRRIEVKVS
jgi:HSP20 family protein